MIIFLIGAALWVVVAVLGFMLWRRDSQVAIAATREGAKEWLGLIPRLAIGIVGSGFLAALLPEELVRSWLGESSGLVGLLIATAAGTLVPGGPVVGFAIGATALKSGAALGPVTAFVTAWALFALQRIFVWELPFMPARLVWVRVVACLPMPIIAAYAMILISG